MSKFAEFLTEFAVEYRHAAPLWHAVLRRHFGDVSKSCGVIRLLELGSGLGEHAFFYSNLLRRGALGGEPVPFNAIESFAPALLEVAADDQSDDGSPSPPIFWQPTEYAPAMPALLKTFQKWQEHAPKRVAACVLPPRELDLSAGNVVEACKAAASGFPPAPASDNAPNFALMVNVLHIIHGDSIPCVFQALGAAMAVGGIVAVYGPLRIGGKYTVDTEARFDAWLKNAYFPFSGIRDFEFVRDAAQSAGFSILERVSVPDNNYVLVFRKS